MQDVTYCDNCGEQLAPEDENWFHEVMIDVASANAGESAVLCARCARYANKRDEDGMLRAAGLL